MYTSEKLSKKLKEVGFQGESEFYLEIEAIGIKPRLWKKGQPCISSSGKVSYYFDPNNKAVLCYPTYDILYDLCIKYAKEVWGSDDWHKINDHTIEVYYQLFNGNRENAEQYIIDNSILFNSPSN